MEAPIYLFTGFIESGKTTLIREVVTSDPDFLEPGVTLLLQCEEGETSFDQSFLQDHNIVMHPVEEPTQFCAAFWQDCKRAYHPAQIIIEYNGTWDMESILNSEIPDDFLVSGIYSTVDASTAELYLTNMRKMFMEQLKESNLIIFNRCTEETQKLKFRRNLKAMNPQVQIAFEKADGTMYENEADIMPFDYSKDIINVDDMDYGVWYLDAMEHPERYVNKEICFTARFCAGADSKKRQFVPGRHIMTCCEEDIQFMGYICTYEEETPFVHGDWVAVRVVVDYRYHEIYREEGPVLTLIHIEANEKPEQELVCFI